MDDQHLVDERFIDRFDDDYLDDATLDRVLASVTAACPAIGAVADFGGGNGRLLDRVLDRIPAASGTNYEISARLRSLNAAAPRKSVVAQSFLSAGADSQFDLAFINWVLHHLVGPDLESTRRMIAQAASAAWRALRPGGALVVAENLLESAIPDAAASAALFAITRSRLLKPVVSRMRDGSAIAGVGVYYLSEAQLRRVFARFEHVATVDHLVHDYGWKLKLIGITRVQQKMLVFRKPAVRVPGEA